MSGHDAQISQPIFRQTQQMRDSLSDALLTRLRRFLTGAATGVDFRTAFWLALSLGFSAYFANQALHHAFSSQYVVQDDARQHVFWMERFLDSQLFPRDLIADYFQSVAPSGYSTFYYVMAQLGIDPLLLNKLLPMVLGLITTAFCFGVCLQFLPVPAAAFFGTLILNQSLWMQDDLVSATPRAFLYPLFLAFLYYLVRKAWLTCLTVIVLQGLFYPSTVFITAGVLVLRLVTVKKRLHFSRDRRDYLFCAAGLAVVVCVLSLYALKLRGIGPVMTASEARTLPEFLPGGRTSFFGYDAWRFWLTRRRSGLLPYPLLADLPLYGALLLPFLIYYRRAFPLAQKITQSINVLPRVVVASLLMFAAAHIFLFRLHNPSRYTEHTLRIVLAAAAGIAAAIVVDALLDWASRSEARRPARQAIALTLTAILISLLVLYPRFVPNFPDTKYRTGREPELYKFFSLQRPDALVASLAQEVRNIPTFSKRSILVAREYALPYHTRYYSHMQERAIDLISASYSPDLHMLQNFIRKYGVSLVLVDRNAFQPDYIERDSWMMQYQPAAREAVANLRDGRVPALSKLMDSCSAFRADDLTVVDAECILSTRE
jgi:hypothetical protein